VKTASKSAISTRGLTRRYGDRAVVDSLDLEVPSGQIFGFLVPNAAGKSTTIRMLAGILQPSGGEGAVLGFCASLYGGAERAEIEEARRLYQEMGTTTQAERLMKETGEGT
jgi:ABC-type uncharacterized transport system ATPase subunit